MNKSRKSIIQIIILIILVLIVLAVTLSLRRKKREFQKSGYYFDTYVSLTVFSESDEKYLDECLNLCEHYENLFSKTVEGSDIYRINHAEGNEVSVDEETYYLIGKALEYCEETGGAVDITIEPLLDKWGFSHSSLTVENGNNISINSNIHTSKPDDELIKETLQNVDYKTVVLSAPSTVKLENPDASMDLGFIAKGYIADKLKEYLVSNGVEHAIISLGGNIIVIGSKPDGSDYNIGIKDPDNTNEIINSVKVKNKSVVTSGTYERYVEYEGIKYHHILDTSTGYPVDNKIKSVTIISESSLDGDALSTICLILGKEKSSDILKKHNAEAIFIDS